jgi:hypothetical protein
MATYGEPVYARINGRKAMFVPVVGTVLEGVEWCVRSYVEIYIEAWREPAVHVYVRSLKVGEKCVRAGELDDAVKEMLAAARARAEGLAGALAKDAAALASFDIAGPATYIGVLPKEIQELWIKS